MRTAFASRIAASLARGVHGAYADSEQGSPERCYRALECIAGEPKEPAT